MANTALGNGCPESRSVVARSGVDPAEIGWPPLQPCTRGPSQRLLSVGRLAPEKGHEVAIRALALLKDLDVELVIVGDGPCLSSLKEQAFELGVMDRCEFVGYLERRALGAQYGAADLAIQPSISEASGLAVIEALVTGTPVVASRIGGVPEIITDGSDGLLVPPRSPSELATAVRSLLEVPERLDCMRANAAARARDFHWDTLLSQWVKDVETRFQRK